ncbi:hypothetical protein [Capnocytophaga gingivalis]|nr:hypothetical protein [Capnocytophaga gingivalis]
MPTHSTYPSSVDVATGAVLSYGFDVEAEKKILFIQKKLKRLIEKKN